MRSLLDASAKMNPSSLELRRQMDKSTPAPQPEILKDISIKALGLSIDNV